MILSGNVRADARAPGGFEISVVGGQVAADRRGLPDHAQGARQDFLLSNRHLWLRSKRQWAILRVRDAVIAALRDFFDERGFVCVDSPIFTPAACEGTTTLFEVELLRPGQGLPHAVRPALRRGRRDGVRQGLLLRADLPRGEDRRRAAT